MAAKLIPKIEDVVENVVEDLGVPGIAAIVLLPVLVPVVASVGKPLAKATVKGGIVLYEKGKGVIATGGYKYHIGKVAHLHRVRVLEGNG